MSFCFRVADLNVLNLAPPVRGKGIMTKIFSFFGFVLGFVLMSVLLAGVSSGGSVAAHEDTIAACEADLSLSGGYGISVAACLEKK